MKRILVTLFCASAIVAGSSTLHAQGDGGYRLVPNWVEAAGRHVLRLEGQPPPPAEREAQAAARRARGGGPGAGGGGRSMEPGQGPTNQPGISGLAIDAQDRIYVFNRGEKPVMVFDRDGNLLLAGGDQEINGKKINPSWQHSGGVDWDGNVYIIERDAHRIVKLSPKLDKFLLQLGTTNEKGNDPTHLDLPSGIAILRSGNIVVTDGYGNNRVILFDKNGKFIKQVAKGAGGPADKGTGPGEWNLPHKLAVDADENLYIIDREGHRLQVFDKNLNYIREIKNDWNPWDVEHLAQGHRRHRLHRRSQGRARAEVPVEGRQDPRDLGQAGLGPRRVRLGARHRRRLEGRGLRGGHLRAADTEVRPRRRRLDPTLNRDAPA